MQNNEGLAVKLEFVPFSGMSAEQRTFLECLSFFSPPQPINTAKQRKKKERKKKGHP